MKKFAIIGFGGAGYSAAKEIRRLDQQAQIDVYSDTETGPYNPMLTTYYVKGAIPYEGMFPFGTLEKIVCELKINYHSRQPVTGLKADEKKVILQDGSEKKYDRILISTGASAIMPSIPGITFPGVFKMRTAEDARILKETLDEGKIRDCLVIGASWVGIKVVEDAAERGITCTLVDGAPWMFSQAIFEETSRRVQKNLEDRGIKFYGSQMLSAIEQQENGKLAAVMQNGRKFYADMIAVCIGVKTNTGFIRNSSLVLNRGIVTDSHMQTNVEGIYAAGDCCEAEDTQTGAPRNIGLWMNAVQQGRVAGANMAGSEAEFGGNILVNLAHYLDYDFISIGNMSECMPEDPVYEYEDEKYYIRGVKKKGKIQCLNVIHSEESNGILKNIFLKALKNPSAAIDRQSICWLYDKGFPESFVNFLQQMPVNAE